METESAIINLGNGHNAIVDLEDLPRLSEKRWRAKKRHNTYYAIYGLKGKQRGQIRYMHHMVIGKAPEGMEVDHINGNGLDNRKINLRFCTHKENIRAGRKANPKATSRYKGVTWDVNRKKWHVSIKGLDGRRIFLGRFDSELDAANAYDKKAVELFGDFAYLNFPKPPEDADRLFPE